MRSPDDQSPSLPFSDSQSDAHGDRAAANFAVSIEPWNPGEEQHDEESCTFLQLDPPLEQTVQGTLLELFLQGACMRITKAEAPGLGENQIIAFRARHDAKNWEFITPAMVRHAVEGDDGVLTIGLEFVSPQVIHDVLQGEVASSDDRRTMKRVAPTGPEPALHLLGKNSTLKAEIHDISVVGACVCLPKRRAAHLEIGDELPFRLGLPGFSHPIEGTARIMRCTPDGNTIRFGLRFELHSEAHQGWAVMQLTRYVDQHLDRHLRGAA